MNVALRQRMTVDQFLEWEERQEFRHEFDGIEPSLMVGGARNHARLQRNLAIVVGGRLGSGPCEFLGSDMKLRMAETVRYPDGMVVCSRGAGRDSWLNDPIVVFEVLSPGTQSTDRLEKMREYCAVASVVRYVMFEQERIAATVVVRTGEGWSTVVLLDADVLSMPEVGVTVALSDLYVGVDVTAA